jgi:hypothetical protein
MHVNDRSAIHKNRLTMALQFITNKVMATASKFYQRAVAHELVKTGECTRIDAGGSKDGFVLCFVGVCDVNRMSRFVLLLSFSSTNHAFLFFHHQASDTKTC